MPITSGIYVITNVQQHNPVVLKNANDEEPIQGHYKQEHAIEQWHWRVVDLNNGLHSIQNVEYKRYANCGSRAGLNAHVMGAGEEQEWHIQAIGSGGEYTIGAIDSKNFWMLPTKGKETPVELHNVPDDRKCWWTFKNVETGALVKEDATYIAYLFPLQPLPILPFSPLRLDFVVIQEMTDNSISNASRTIAGACGRLVSLGRLQSDALCVNIIEFTHVPSGIYFDRSYDVVTFEKLRSLGGQDISRKEYDGDSSLPTTALRGLRNNTTKIAILNLNATLFQQRGQEIIELVNHLAEHKITLILTPIQLTWEETFSKSDVFTELKRLSFYRSSALPDFVERSVYSRFKQEGRFSDYIVKYNESVVLPKLKRHPELRSEIRPNIPHIIEVLKDEDQHTRSVAVAAFSHLAEYTELRGVIFETTLKIIEMLDGDRDEAKATASALIALTKHVESRPVICQAIPHIIEVLRSKSHGPQSAIVEVVSKFTEHTELREVICPAIPGLLEVLKNKNHDVHSAVVEVLSQFTQHTELRDAISKEVVRIIEMLKADGHEAEAAASALIKLAKCAELREVIRPATPHIVEILKDTKHDAQSAVVEVLCKFTEHAELRDAISEAVFRIIEMLKGGSSRPNLFERGTDFRDGTGCTPLAWAAGSGYDAFVRILLAQEGVEANSKDRHGRTPLSWAACNGHDVVVRLMLARESVDVDSKDIHGRTPLSWAACNGHDAVVRLLLEHKGVDADSKDIHGRTSLSWAASNGHDAVARLLLAQEGVDANSEDIHGQTPFFFADQNGRDAVVRLLPALNVMLSRAEKSLLIMAPWHGTETENPQMQQVILNIAGHCTVYIQAIDASIKTAEDGYSLSSDAVDLCDFILDPDIEAMEIQDYIEDAQSKAKEARQDCKDTLNKFRAVQMGLIEMSATMPREALAVQEGDKGSFTRLLNVVSIGIEAANTTSRKQPMSIKAAMKELQLAGMDVAQLSKTISEFVGWWADMETKLVTADKNSSKLVPNRGNQLRVKGLQKKWTQIMNEYGNYKVEIAKLRGFYPPGTTLGEDTNA